MPTGPTTATTLAVATGDVLVMRNVVADPQGLKFPPTRTTRPYFHVLSFAIRSSYVGTIIIELDSAKPPMIKPATGESIPVLHVD